MADWAITRRQFGKIASASTFVLGAGLTSPGFAASPSLLEAAKKEGKVVVYGDSIMVPTLVAAFGKLYPDIQVTSVPGAGWPVYNRFASEKASGRTIADVVIFGDDVMITAERAGYIAPTPLDDPGAFTSVAQPKEGKYVTPQVMINTMIYNESALDGRKTPKDWSDLANLGPEWSDQIILADIRNSTSTLVVFGALYMNLGAEKAGQILAGLKKLRVENAPATGVQVAKLLSGERSLCLSLHLGFYQQMRDKGAPVVFILPPSGVMTQKGAIALSNGSEHPNAAQLFVNFAMGPQGAALYSAQGTYHTLKAAPPPGSFPPFAELNIQSPDVSKLLEKRDEIIKWWLAGLDIS
ncbi:extracellular solute-binding protein [Starkeya sp. ORNL1]|uniref:ABC transporter substrate-binding protein n=1 Tax=Starkeya sp. ORNL1 TaxID=2709380 RepID=UPI0014645F26|nr:extracellular solute-binding protein [Starkeya sp. ORNL1]QJP17356.1 extracellular solute-binding protein [Starkeya sp. ORNL1]